MKTKSGNAKLRFAVCIDNTGYLASLELHKIYRVLPDRDAEKDGDVRVIDESGEDYLFSAKRFVPIQVPSRVKQGDPRQTLKCSLMFFSVKSLTALSSHPVDPGTFPAAVFV